jgi:hypothetical protein
VPRPHLGERELPTRGTPSGPKSIPRRRPGPGNMLRSPRSSIAESIWLDLSSAPRDGCEPADEVCGAGELRSSATVLDRIPDLKWPATVPLLTPSRFKLGHNRDVTRSRSAWGPRDPSSGGHVVRPSSAIGVCLTHKGGDQHRPQRLPRSIPRSIESAIA